MLRKTKNPRDLAIIKARKAHIKPLLGVKLNNLRGLMSLEGKVNFAAK